MEFIPFVAALALIWKLVDFVKFVRSGDRNGALTQLATWGAGVVVFFVLRESDWSAGIPIGNVALAELNAWSVVLVGMSVGSAGSVGFDFKKAVDHSDSAQTPALLTGRYEAAGGVTTPKKR